jgi:hypothetical protein
VHIDRCGYETCELECPNCKVALFGVVDPLDDKLLISVRDSGSPHSVGFRVIRGGAEDYVIPEEPLEAHL